MYVKIPPNLGDPNINLLTMDYLQEEDEDPTQKDEEEMQQLIY